MKQAAKTAFVFVIITAQFAGIFGVPEARANGSLPDAYTLAASASLTSATLYGNISPNGVETHAWFDVGTSVTFLNQSVGYQLAGGGFSTVTVSRTLYDFFKPNTTYYYRVVAQNSFGMVRGSIVSFTTSGNSGGGSGGNGGVPPSGSAPSAVTAGASNTSPNGATLNGSVVANGAYTTAWFEYGFTTALGQTTEGQFAGTGYVNANVSHAIAQLSGNATYYYRIVAQNGYGTGYGSIVSFTTGPGAPPPSGNLPLVTTGAATNLAERSAILNGSVVPNGNPTTAWFEYGTSEALLGREVGHQSVGSGNSFSALSFFVSGLSPNTVYYYRVMAQNGFGTRYGTIANFKTGGVTATPAPAAPPKPTSVVTIVPAVEKNESLQPSVDKLQPKPGEEITYTLAYKNVGNAAITNLILTVVFPAEVEYKDADPAPKLVAHQNVAFTLGTLNANKEGRVTMHLTVKEEAKPGAQFTLLAILSYTDPLQKPQSVSAAVTLQVAGDEKPLLASLVGSVGDISWSKLLFIVAALFALLFFFVQYARNGRMARRADLV